MADNKDAPEFDDLMGVDLSQLDLEKIELYEEPEGSDLWRWLGMVVVLAMGGGVLWLPTTEYYHHKSHGSWLFAAVCVAATFVGVLLGRFLWRWAEEAAERWRRKRPPKTAPSPAAPPSPLRRTVTLGVAIAGAAAILFALDPYDLSAGQTGYSNLWYLAALGAIVVGFLLGRWLLMQQTNPFAGDPQPVKFAFPPWFKWISLALIVGGALVVWVGMEIFAGERRENLEFTLGGVAFVIGIMAAIWVARRFDETEEKIKKGDTRPPNRPKAAYQKKKYD